MMGSFKHTKIFIILVSSDVTHTPCSTQSPNNATASLSPTASHGSQIVVEACEGAFPHSKSTKQAIGLLTSAPAI